MQIQSNNNSSLSFPSFTIVIEWGRFLQTDEAWRAKKTLERLCEQILQISEKISNAEIMIIYDDEESDISKLKEFVMKELQPCIKLINLRIIPSPGLFYYEVKNFGAKNSSNELIILVDSDVIIQDNWLVGYLESFRQPEVNVVSGHTYLGMDTLLEKVLGLVSFQPLPDGHHQMYENLHFYGNNLAMRRKVFLAHPFPKLNTFHGQVIFLMNDLIKNNIKIYRQPNCKAAHPMPVTFRQFVTWGLVQGLALPFKRRAFNIGQKLNLYDRKEGNQFSIRATISRSLKRIRHVGLSPKVFIAACGILPAYFFLNLVGLIIATLWPNYYNYMVRNKWDLWL